MRHFQLMRAHPRWLSDWLTGVEGIELTHSCSNLSPSGMGPNLGISVEFAAHARPFASRSGHIQSLPVCPLSANSRQARDVREGGGYASHLSTGPVA